MIWSIRSVAWFFPLFTSTTFLSLTLPGSDSHRTDCSSSIQLFFVGFYLWPLSSLLCEGFLACLFPGDWLSFIWIDLHSGMHWCPTYLGFVIWALFSWRSFSLIELLLQRLCRTDIEFFGDLEQQFNQADEHFHFSYSFFTLLFV